MTKNNPALKKKILAIDDDVDFLKLLKLNLNVGGYDVITAFDGEEGLKKVKSEKPDIVLLDIGLPKLNGDQVCRQIRSDQSISKTPVIMLTGRNTDVERIVSRVIGANIYITKPFETQALLAQIESLLK